MIYSENEYYQFIQKMGVGRKDKVASSPKSYISYLNSVSKILKKDITPNLLKNEDDISEIALQIDGKRADKTIKNYCSAMRQYINFVHNKNL